MTERDLRGGGAVQNPDCCPRLSTGLKIYTQEQSRIKVNYGLEASNNYGKRKSEQDLINMKTSQMTNRKKGSINYIS